MQVGKEGELHYNRQLIWMENAAEGKKEGKEICVRMDKKKIC